MANQESNRRSNRRSKGRQSKPKGNQRTVNGQQTITNTKDNTKDNTNTTNRGFQRMDAGAGMERLPSNAPTMAIAPSDYEHIFHEATGAVGGRPQQVGTPPGRTAGTPSPPPPVSPPQPVQLPPPLPPQAATPILPPVPPRTPEANNYPSNNIYQQQRTETPLLISPDGYTILGQQNPPNFENHRRIALPAHVVRASNQFSRAALARVSRYLASRAEPYSR